MITNICKNTRKIVATICHTHYRHPLQLGHIPLHKTTRLAVAAKLTDGVSANSIIDHIRSNVGDRCERLHLITKKDIRNIECAFKINHTQRHSDDAKSIALWVEEMKANPSNPVILFKEQGSPQPSDCDNLGIDDFALAIQTPMQAEMLRTLGNDKIICLDSTHGTTGYGFLLITVLVVDEYGEGFPVGWCLSNREDQLLLINFFSAIRKKCGIIQAKFFMSDDAEQFFTAWIAVFGRGTTSKLLCSWHVDRAWRTSLSKITNKNLQQTVYQNLRVLMDETNIQRFEDLLSKTIMQLNHNDTMQFYQYFNQKYVPRKHQWAKCFHLRAGINTNMYLEAFHYVLKYIYLNGKVNKRVDRCVHMLLKYARDKTFDRILKKEKGKTTAKITSINQRHKHSTSLSLSKVKQISDTEWEFISSSTTAIYTVTFLQQPCPALNCFLRCQQCKICIHSYTCNCPDSLIIASICKHVHFIATMISSTLSTTTTSLSSPTVTISSPTVTISSPTANISSPTVTISSPTANISSPTVTISSPTATVTISSPTATVTISSPTATVTISSPTVTISSPTVISSPMATNSSATTNTSFTDPLKTTETQSLLKFVQNRQLSTNDKHRQNLCHKISFIKQKITSCSENTLKSIDTYLNTIINLIELNENRQAANFPTIKEIPANKKIQPQQQAFHSTRKRPRQASTRIAKPTQEQKTNIVLSLCNNKPLYASRAEIISKT
jgi:hypothetical protein